MGFLWPRIVSFPFSVKVSLLSKNFPFLLYKMTRTLKFYQFLKFKNIKKRRENNPEKILISGKDLEKKGANLQNLNLENTNVNADTYVQAGENVNHNLS